MLAAIVCIAALASCATPHPVSLPEPLREPKPEPSEPDSTLVDEQTALRADETRFEVKEIPPQRTAAGLERAQEPLVAADGSKVDVNFDNVPLPTFINAVFGNLLNLSFQMDPAVRSDESLVTLRASEGQTPAQLYDLAVQVLDSFGPCDGCAEDVNGDGFVNGLDAAAVATHFGPCP